VDDEEEDFDEATLGEIVGDSGVDSDEGGVEETDEGVRGENSGEPLKERDAGSGNWNALEEFSGAPSEDWSYELRKYTSPLSSIARFRTVSQSASLTNKVMCGWCFNARELEIISVYP